MDVFEAVQRRRSVRAYLKKDVPRELVMRILEAARLAPSAEAIQPWYFIVLTDQEKKDKIAKSGRFARFISKAPVVVVGCGDREASPKWFKVDVAIAMEHMVLEATELGLGTCWVGSFSESLVKQVLKIPERFSVVALLALGYPAKKVDYLGKLVHLVRGRKKLERIVGLNEYGKAF